MGKTIMASAPRGGLRFGLRLPIWLYRAHLGWLLGERFLLLNHAGRKSGRIHQSVIEVVKHDPASDAYFVVSGWGSRSDWYQNIHQTPDATVWVGRRKLAVRAEDVPESTAVDILEEYTRRYPMAFKELTGLFLGERLQPGREASQRLAEKMPMVVFRPRR